MLVFFSGDMFISLGIASSFCKVVLGSGTFCDEVFVILSAILLQIKSPFTPAAFSIGLFETVLSTSVRALATPDLLPLLTSF